MHEMPMAQPERASEKRASYEQVKRDWEALLAKATEQTVLYKGLKGDPKDQQKVQDAIHANVTELERLGEAYKKGLKALSDDDWKKLKEAQTVQFSRRDHSSEARILSGEAGVWDVMAIAEDEKLKKIRREKN